MTEEEYDELCDPTPVPACPKCGAELLNGFGLAGGGYGPYVMCSADGCDYFDKTQVRE